MTRQNIRDPKGVEREGNFDSIFEGPSHEASCLSNRSDLLRFLSCGIPYGSGCISSDLSPWLRRLGRWRLVFGIVKHARFFVIFVKEQTSMVQVCRQDAIAAIHDVHFIIPRVTMAMTCIYAEMFRAEKTCSRGRADQSLRLRKYGNERFLLEDEECNVTYILL